MSRIKQVFARLQTEQKKALIPFITAGDPQPGMTVELMHTLVSNGADILELGIPFSDPMADGPVIQLADERALAHGVTTHDVLAMVAQFREQDQSTPVVLMGYLNPIEAFGYEAFAAAAAEAGVDGMITVDLPPEAAGLLSSSFAAADLDMIFLIAPTTRIERIKRIAAAGTGYLYYVSLKGVTGSAALDTAAVAERLTVIREHTDLPIAVGFGIRDGETARQVAAVADGVVVGSALVKQIEAHQQDPEQLHQQLGRLMQDLRQGTDSQ